MKRIAVIAALVAWSALVMVAAAQGPQGPRGGPRRWYDPKTEVSFQGVVEKVDQVSYPRGRYHSGQTPSGQEPSAQKPNAQATAIRLTVKSDAETFVVRVGPTS